MPICVFTYIIFIRFRLNFCVFGVFVVTKKISFFANLSYFLVLLVFVGVRICSGFGLFSFLGDYADSIMGFVTQVGIILLLPLLVFKCLSKKSFKETFSFCTYKKTSWKVLASAVVLGVIVFFLNFYVSSFFQNIITGLGYKPVSNAGGGLPNTWWVLLLDLFTTAVLAGVCEETLHRGLLLHGNSNLGITKSIILSGVLFGLLHLNIMQFFYATLIGIFLGYLCVLCNSIFPCMIVHFMNNALCVIVSFGSQNGWGIGKIFTLLADFLTKNLVLGGIFFVLLLGLLVILAWELTKYMAKESFKYSFGKRQKELANLAIRDSFFKQIDDIRNGEKEGNSIFRTSEKTIFLDFKQFVNFVGESIEKNKNASNSNANFVLDESNSSKQIFKTKFGEKLENKEIKNLELKTKILIYGSFALGTIF